MIPYGRQEITQADIDAVVSVLRSDHLTQGPVVPCFEQAVATHVGANYALAVNSATSALHIACLALGLGEGDWLWTSPITFVASANCGLYCGAQVDFVDIDPHTYNLCPTALEIKLVEAQKGGVLPKVLVVVHLCGQPCDMAAIYALGQKYGFRIVEDASHAIGGKYKGEFIGSCRYSDITVFSFHPVKIITTGEGGMALTNSKELVTKMELLRSHGVTRDVAQMTHAPDGPWYYQQVGIGFNYRMTEIQAALGLSQLKRLDSYVVNRNELAKRYEHLLRPLPVKTPWQHPDSYSAYHLFVIRLRTKEIRKPRLKVFEELRQRNIGVNLHYIPVHTQPYYQRMGFNIGDYPNSELFYQEAITIPLYPGLSLLDQNYITNSLQEILNG